MVLKYPAEGEVTGTPCRTATALVAALEESNLQEKKEERGSEDSGVGNGKAPVSPCKLRLFVVEDLCREFNFLHLEMEEHCNGFNWYLPLCCFSGRLSPH